MQTCRSWLLLLAVSLTNAQSPGTLTGTVFDSQHRSAASAEVLVHSPGSSQDHRTSTDAKGTFRFVLPAGSYLVSAKAKDGTEANGKTIDIATGKTISLNFILQPAFSDEPTFTVAGVTDNTYRGGHGSDSLLRSSETLTKQTSALAKESQDPGDAVTQAKQHQRAAISDPSEANLFTWGNDLLLHHAASQASEIFSQGVNRYPQSLRMLLGWAAALYSGGQYEAASRAFFRACDLEPANPQPYSFLGQVQAKEIRELPGFEERMARIARLQTQEVNAQYLFAMALLDRPDKAGREQARRLLKTAITLDRRFSPAYLQLGILDANDGRLGDAISNYQQAVLFDNASQEAHYRLSIADKQVGKDDEAARELALYKQLSQRSAAATEAERRSIQQFLIQFPATANASK